MKCTILLGVLLMTASCALEPDVGGPLVERCTNEDSDPSTTVSYRADLVPLFERASGGCIECHTPGGSNPVGISVGGLDMSSYETLLAGGSRTSSDIVLPGEPCASTLYLKLTSAPFGSQMPGDGPPFWTDSELQLLTDWIAEGAENN